MTDGMLERIDKKLSDMEISENSASEKAGLARDYIRSIRRGVSRNPKTEHLLKLSRFFGVRLEWLLTGEGPEVDEGMALTPRQRAFLGQLDRLPPEEQDRLLKLARALEQQDDGNCLEIRRD